MALQCEITTSGLPGYADRYDEDQTQMGAIEVATDDMKARIVHPPP